MQIITYKNKRWRQVGDEPEMKEWLEKSVGIRNESLGGNKLYWIVYINIITNSFSAVRDTRPVRVRSVQIDGDGKKAEGRTDNITNEQGRKEISRKN